MKQWCMASTKSPEESVKLLNLKMQGYEAYLSQYKKTRDHERRIETIPAPLFQEHLFAEVDIDAQNWAYINPTIGVNKLVQFGSKPIPISNDLIDEIGHKH